MESDPITMPASAAAKVSVRKTAAGNGSNTMPNSHIFQRFSYAVAKWAGSAWAFVASVLTIVIWLVFGPVYKYSDTWQLVINTGTTIVTFLMVFLIQNTQNRDAKAMQLKLDEVIRAIKNARNSMIALEDMSDEELDQLDEEFQRIRGKAAKQRKDTEGKHADA